MTEKTVFVTGATGYLGGALIPRLLARGHRVLALVRRLSATRDGALRLGLVTRAQMTAALAAAVENPPGGVRVVTVPGIRAA